jgi:cytidylate kinase
MAVLTVSREYGSGGREIGQAVAASLAYDYVDKDRILGDVRQVGEKWEEWGRDLDEHCPSIWEKYDWSFRGFGALVQSTILHYAARDRVVIMGRGGHLLLEDIPLALRIRVVAPLEARVERVMHRESLDRETAQWLAEKTDRDRAAFVQALYGKRWDARGEFDRTFDTGSQPLEKIAAEVIGLLRERERLNTAEARKTLALRALAAKVKAGIFTNAALFVPTLEVTVDGETLVLRGTVHNIREHERVEAAARQLAGNALLRCALHYRG